MDLFEIELIICIKMDLALNYWQMLICHKTQIKNKQLTVISFVTYEFFSEPFQPTCGRIQTMHPQQRNKTVPEKLCVK